MSKTNVAPNTFEESTADVAKYRLQLQSCPSEIIQARISFDAVCKLELSTLTPLQQQRISTLKKELISYSSFSLLLLHGIRVLILWVFQCLMFFEIFNM